MKQPIDGPADGTVPDATMTEVSPPASFGQAIPPAQLHLDVHNRGNKPLYRHLAHQLRALVNDGVLTPGTRLPPTRELAEELGINRSVIVDAFGELRADGIFKSHHRAGTFVGGTSKTAVPPPTAFRPDARWSARLAKQAVVDPAAGIDLRLGKTSLFELPVELWRKACKEAGRHLPPAGYGDPYGDPALRRAVAAYLGRSRGIAATPANIMITVGAGKAIELIARAVLRPGDRAAMEVPGYSRAADIFMRTGAALVDMDVDREQGANVGVLPALDDAPVLVHVTPAHQYPVGSRLSVERRKALIDWARATGALIIENDYDHEFLHEGLRLPTLYSLAPDCVAHVGTFAKALSPSLRAGYIVGPERLLGALADAVDRDKDQVPWTTQRILDWLIRSHVLETNIVRVRKHYRQVRDALLESLRDAHGFLEVFGTAGGLHVGLSLTFVPKEGSSLVKALARSGLVTDSERMLYMGKAGIDGNTQYIGYGHLSADQAREVGLAVVRCVRQLHNEAA